MNEGVTKNRKTKLKIVLSAKNSNEKPSQLSLNLKLNSKKLSVFFAFKIFTFITCIVISKSVYRETCYFFLERLEWKNFSKYSSLHDCF